MFSICSLQQQITCDAPELGPRYGMYTMACDSRLQVRIPAMTLPGYFWDRWPYFAGKLSWDITTTQVNSALHLSGVAKSSTSFGWGKGGKVTSAELQVTLCDLIWHVISRSGVVISITNCYIRLTLLYFTCHLASSISDTLVVVPVVVFNSVFRVTEKWSGCSRQVKVVSSCGVMLATSDFWL